MRGGVCWDMISSSASSIQQGNLLRHYVGYQTVSSSGSGASVLSSASPSLIGGVDSNNGSGGGLPPQTMTQQAIRQGWEMQMHHKNLMPMIVPKQEPLDEDKTDSGIHSGSDFHSSSPGSDSSSQEYQPPAKNERTSTMISTPCSSTAVPPFNNQLHFINPPISTHTKNFGFNYHVGFNTITEPVQLLPKSVPAAQENNRLTPNSSPVHQPEEKSTISDPLKQLQMTFEKTDDYLPSSLASPKMSEHSNDDDNTLEEFDEQGLRIPKVNSHGKVKMFKCKQCDFVAITKLDFWEHSKGHIKTDKLLTCPKCPFVTEYKHHLEYHLRNHFGSKPFKCDKCSYSCVNKSMLNSHMKSHSNIYQYRCSDCSYATKYCHSLKLHLRKYCHKPAMVLNPDGTPNPLPIIDVYGTRRGPKMKSHHGEEINQIMQNHPLAQMMLSTPPQMQLPFPYSFLGAFGSNPLGNNPLFFPQLGHQLQQMLKSPKAVEDGEDDEMMERVPSPLAMPLGKGSPEVLDLSKPDLEQQQMGKNRRKGKAFKLDHNSLNDESFSEEEDGVLVEPEVVLNEDPESKDSIHVDVDSTFMTETKVKAESNNNDYTCQFCNITYGDAVLYTMHMGYHGYNDPFACNMCGEKCNDKVSFFLHIARNPHT